MDFSLRGDSPPAPAPTLRDRWRSLKRKAARVVADVGLAALVIAMFAAFVSLIVAVVLGPPVLIALAFRFVWDWFAASFGGPPMPFGVALGCVLLAGILTGRFRVKVDAEQSAAR